MLIWVRWAGPSVGARDPYVQAGCQVFIGRERERELVHTAAANPPSVAFIEGEAGVGKTRLVEEALSPPPSRRTLVGRCHPTEDSFLLGPVVEALGALRGRPSRGSLSPVTGVLRPLLPELARDLPPTPEPVGDPLVDRHRLLRAVRELLDAVGPAVLVLEDLHWADAGTLELIELLVTHPPAGLALVLTYRREGLDSRGPLLGLAARVPRGTYRESVSLVPLTSDQGGDLAGTIIGVEAVTGQFARDLHDWTAGIPFAVKEVIELLRDSQWSTSGTGKGESEKPGSLGVPPAVRDALLQRLAGLGTDARIVAEAACVLGAPATEELIGKVAGLPPSRAREALCRLLASAIVLEVRDGRFALRHALGAQAVYDLHPEAPGSSHAGGPGARGVARAATAGAGGTSLQAC